MDPYIAVNSGFGDAHTAAEEVEYANGSLETRMGKLRASNGHPEPYNVKWWSIGNEMYGWWQLGNMALDNYVIKHNLFAKAMRRVDPTIKLFAAGAAPDETTVTHISTRVTHKLKTEYDSPADFTGGLLRNCADNIDFLSEHFYCYSGMGWDLAKNDFVPVQESITDYIRRVPNRVRCKAEAYQDYLERIPALREKKIPMAIDEWNYGDLHPFSLKGALAVAEGLHEMYRHTGIIAAAAYTMGTSCLAHTRTDAVLQTNGLVFKLYRNHFGTLPLEVAGNSPMPPIQGEPGGDKPRVSSGSPTYPLDVSAALTADRKVLTLAVINPTKEPREIGLEFRGLKLSGKGRAYRLSGPDENAFNEPGRKPGVEITDWQVKKPLKALTVGPLSINLYELDVR
jgi:alpha-N-arabinofuranosidase